MPGTPTHQPPDPMTDGTFPDFPPRGVSADDYFRAMGQARVDNSVDRTFRSFLAPDLLILETWLATCGRLHPPGPAPHTVGQHPEIKDEELPRTHLPT